MALLPVDEALARILDGVKPLPGEQVQLNQSLGRVLAAPVIAKRNQPPFDASAMDGYALRQSDISQQLKVAGVSAAGHAYRGSVKPGQAIRILTGAPVPHGADTIVIQENVVREGEFITVNAPSPAGKHIRVAGLDFNKGDELLPVNTTLLPRDLGLAAAGNAAMLRVRRKPVVTLLATGDELVQPGSAARADQIYSSNSHALEALVKSYGGDVVNLGIVKDSLRATVAAVRKGMAGDILLTTGGASVGDHDYVQEAFKACGIKIGFWKIALRPGKPLMYGRKGKLHVLGLPGNPVSAQVTALIFLRPLINALLGLASHSDDTTARLGADMPANDDRQDYVRARLDVAPDGSRIATPLPKQDSSMQRALRESGCLIVRPPHAETAKAGAPVPILLL